MDRNKIFQLEEEMCLCEKGELFSVDKRNISCEKVMTVGGENIFLLMEETFRI